MKLIIILALFVSSSVYASTIEKTETKICNELKAEAKQKFLQINEYTYQSNGKVIEFICRNNNKVSEIAVYSEKEYFDLISQIKQMKLEREQKEQQQKENTLKKVRSLYIS